MKQKSIMIFPFRSKKRIWFLRSALIIAGLWLLSMPYYHGVHTGEADSFTVSINGTEVGTLSSKEEALKCLRQARRELSLENNSSQELYLCKADMTSEGRSVIFGKVDDSADVVSNMKSVLSSSKYSTLQRSYTIKINDYSTNLASKDDVEKLLRASLDRYDTKQEFSLGLVLDPSREVNVLTTEVTSANDNELTGNESPFPEAGVASLITDIVDKAEPFTTNKDFSDYALGLLSLDFGDKVEIVEDYLPSSEITDLSTAIDDVTKDKETNQIYEVESGDTLSTIAEKFGLTTDSLVAMNDTIDSDTSIIRVSDEIIVTVPEPELSVNRTEMQYYEEDYEADVQYIDVDDWYTTKTEVVQQPSAGHRKVVALVSYSDDKAVSTDIQKEEITYKAVPKIVKRGTIVPPTYIKPLSGGHISSGFGRRSVSLKSASKFHKGIDWSTPVGTAIVASAYGTVSRAGWGSGYGYCIYIDHPDGRQTRYGHLSKILVRVGETVSQGEKIALSGNTGVSTGPHLHFEILIDGSQVNPLNYLN